MRNQYKCEKPKDLWERLANETQRTEDTAASGKFWSLALKTGRGKCSQRGETSGNGGSEAGRGLGSGVQSDAYTQVTKIPVGFLHANICKSPHLCVWDSKQRFSPGK